MCNTFIKSLSNNTFRRRSTQGTTNKKAILLSHSANSLILSHNTHNIFVQIIQLLRRHTARHTTLIQLTAIRTSRVHAPPAEVLCTPLTHVATPCLQDILPGTHHPPTVSDPISALFCVITVLFVRCGAYTANRSTVGRKKFFPPRIIITFLGHTLSGECKFQPFCIL